MNISNPNYIIGDSDFFSRIFTVISKIRLSNNKLILIADAQSRAHQRGVKGGRKIL